MRNFRRLLLVFTLVALNYTFVNAQDDLPINAVAGKCYAKCMIPDQYETVTEQILLKEASARLEIVPAQYENRNEQILVKEGYTVLEIVPAEFSTVTEQIMVKDAGARLEYVPPVYETVTEQVLVQPAQTKWTKGRADRNCLSQDPEKCKVWCLTEVPAQYKTVTRQVLQAPATTRQTPLPAQYSTITRAVVARPAEVRERVVPAEYRTVTKQVMAAPAATREVPIPAEYSTLTTQRLARQGGFTDWVEVLCGKKVTNAVVIQVQNALRARGYDPGPADNKMGPRTNAALMQFQRDNGLPLGNLNIETLRTLGIQY